MSFLDTLLAGLRHVASGGALLPFRPIVNFVGGTVADNPTTGQTDVTIGAPIYYQSVGFDNDELLTQRPVLVVTNGLVVNDDSVNGQTILGSPEAGIDHNNDTGIFDGPSSTVGLNALIYQYLYETTVTGTIYLSADEIDPVNQSAGVVGTVAMLPGSTQNVTLHDVLTSTTITTLIPGTRDWAEMYWDLNLGWVLTRTGKNV